MTNERRYHCDRCGYHRQIGCHNIDGWALCDRCFDAHMVSTESWPAAGALAGWAELRPGPWRHWGPPAIDERWPAARALSGAPGVNAPDRIEWRQSPLKDGLMCEWDGGEYHYSVVVEPQPRFGGGFGGWAWRFGFDTGPFADGVLVAAGVAATREDAQAACRRAVDNLALGADAG